ncbi:MAG: heme-binding protein [Enterococcus sp.]
MNQLATINSTIVLEQEAKYVFNTFNHTIALELLQAIIQTVNNLKERPVGISIYYKEKEILKYLMEGRKESPWLDRKTNTVLTSKHSSLYTFLEQDNNPIYKKWASDDTYAICGGGFPISVKGVIQGAVCVSGLEHTIDHQVIIDSFAQLADEVYQKGV